MMLVLWWSEKDLILRNTYVPNMMLLDVVTLDTQRRVVFDSQVCKSRYPTKMSSHGARSIVRP